MSVDDDFAAFRAEVSGIKPLLQDRILPTPPQRRKIRRRLIDAGTEMSIGGYSDEYQPILLELGRYCHRDLPENQFRRFLRQRERPQVWLDLHGFSIEQARRRVAQFLQQAQMQKHSVVCLIHGKGQGILKQRLQYWLPQDERVLAYETAPPRRGGDGALLVLLRSL